MRAAPARKKKKGPVCRACGCTDNEPCIGGCSWVEKDLCSRCEKTAGVDVTDKRRVTEASDLSGPAPGMILDEKEKKIASLITDKPLYISFTFIPKVATVSVSVHRGDASSASRASVAPADLPRFTDAIQDLIVEQLEKGK